MYYSALLPSGAGIAFDVTVKGIVTNFNRLRRMLWWSRYGYRSGLCVCVSGQ